MKTIERDGKVIVFAKTVFPDPETRPADFLAARCSTAPWIARRRLAELGFPRTLRCLDLQASTPQTHLRVAPGRGDDVKAALSAKGLAWIDGPHGLATLPPEVRISDVLMRAGRGWPQDAVASSRRSPRREGARLAAARRRAMATTSRSSSGRRAR
jgi:hypothetical protein